MTDGEMVNRGQAGLSHPFLGMGPGPGPWNWENYQCFN